MDSLEAMLERVRQRLHTLTTPLHAPGRLTGFLFASAFFAVWISSRPFATAHKSGYDFMPVRAAMHSITAKESQHHVDVLASDAFSGRATGSRGQWLAADYIAKQFQAYGLATLPNLDGFYQKFSAVRRREARAMLSLNHRRRTQRTRFERDVDFSPLNVSGAGDYSAKVVFAGYGISAPEHAYDDYAGLHVSGRVVLVLNGRPAAWPQEAGPGETGYTAIAAKAQNAMQHGAVGILIVDVPEKNLHRMQPERERHAGGSNGWHVEPDLGLDHFPALAVTAKLADRILGDKRDPVTELKRAIDHFGTPVSFEVSDALLRIQVEWRGEKRATQNVLGFLPGSDPILGQEVVVIGAHYDHLGRHNGAVYHGADDNASGTSAILEIAQAFSENVLSTRRSMLFAAFSGEELGLLGSQFYVENPPVPLEQTIAMLNLDMIARNASNEITVVGSNRSRELHGINLAANHEIGFTLVYDGEPYFNRSDQWHFARKKIPAIFYYSGSHRDYHRPTDLAEKIDAQKLTRVARLAFLVAWKTSELDHRPAFHPVSTIW